MKTGHEKVLPGELYKAPANEPHLLSMQDWSTLGSLFWMTGSETLANECFDFHVELLSHGNFHDAHSLQLGKRGTRQVGQDERRGRT